MNREKRRIVEGDEHVNRSVVVIGFATIIIISIILVMYLLQWMAFPQRHQQEKDGQTVEGHLAYDDGPVEVQRVSPRFHRSDEKAVGTRARERESEYVKLVGKIAFRRGGGGGGWGGRGGRGNKGDEEQKLFSTNLPRWIRHRCTAR